MAKEDSRILLLIDDDPAQCRLVATLAARDGWRSLAVESCDEAIKALASKLVD